MSRLICIAILISMIAPIVGCGVAKDTSIQVAVKKALDDNKNISADKLIVNVKDGVVTISGELGTQKEIDLAVQVAMVVEGVVEVKNQMSLPDNYGSTDPIMNDFGLF